MTQFLPTSSFQSMFYRLCLASLLLFSATSWASDAMRCGSRIISVEAAAAEILAACGEPDFRDVQSVGRQLPNEIAESERWTYNFGSNKLLHILHLRNGRLVNIETDGYGFPASRSNKCSSGFIVDGLSKYRLLEQCGEPLTRRNIGFVTALKPGRRHSFGGFSSSSDYYPVEVFREEWVYNFGNRRFLKIVTIEDGVVADVENGDHGFNPR